MSRIKLATPKRFALDEMTLLLVRFDRCRVYAHGDLCESAADARDSHRGKRDSLVSRHQLVYLDPVMHRRLFCGSQHQIVFYDNEFTVRWRRGFDWKQRSQHRRCLRYERKRNECSHYCTLHSSCEETGFTEVRAPFPS